MQGILHPFNQRTLAFTAENNAHKAPVAQGQTEVEQAMGQQLTGDGNVNTFKLDEIDEGPRTWLMFLDKHDLLLGTILTSPGSDAALQRTQGRIGVLACGNSANAQAQ